MGDLEWVMTNTTDGQDVNIDSIVTLPTNSTVIVNAWAQITLTYVDPFGRGNNLDH
jgi:hypothetical protein